MYTIIYHYLSITYIDASLYSGSFLSFLHPFLTLQRKMKEKVGWLFRKLMKGLQEMSQKLSVYGLYVHIWIFKDLILVWEKRQWQFFLFAIIEEIFGV